MSKTIQDYRQIVKVLKLQLLKVREENATLSKSLGVSSDNETSSYSSRLDKLKRINNIIFARHAELFNLFGHRCELIGVSCQMVFRIADKKRDKEVNTQDFKLIMKRLKLGFNEVEISDFVKLITKGDKLFYLEYLQFLSAFQINSEKYPSEGRNYSQRCLIKFAQKAKQNSKGGSVDSIISSISNNESISYESFSKYCQSKVVLKDAQIVAIFVLLDTQTQCLIDKQLFKRQLGKAINLVERGDKSESEDEVQIKKNNNNKNKSPIKKQQVSHDDDDHDDDHDDDKKDEYDLQEETGVEAGGKVKKTVKKQTTLKKGELDKLVSELKKEGLPINNLIKLVLAGQNITKLVRPFNLSDWHNACKSLKPNIKKKKVMEFYKSLDTGNNGSISTDQLLKLWLEGKDSKDGRQMLFKLLARHFREIQSPQFITKFKTEGINIDKDQKVTQEILGKVLFGLDLPSQYLQVIIKNFPTDGYTVNQLVQKMETGGEEKQSKAFKKLDQKKYLAMKKAVINMLPEQKEKSKTNFPKYNRLDEEENPENQKNTKSKNQQNKQQYWETIFKDQWACWSYCLQIASKLTSNWRDHEFGPNNGDPKGYRSLVGNQSNAPAGFPMEDDISWATFEQILKKQQNTTDQVSLFSKDLQPSDIIQGKIGDCWFVSALSIITSNDQYVKGKTIKTAKEYELNPQALTYGIHPAMFHIFKNWGIYVFKFFKGFEPVYVIVDDLFPIETSSSELIFARSPNPGLQWVAFLEKAYTKLHHCYTNMISGDIAQGLNDLTNNLPIKQDMTNNNEQELLSKLKRLHENNQLMGCSINTPKTSKSAAAEQAVKFNDEKTGLFSGHAYSIGDVLSLPFKADENDQNNVSLMRLRNPWGHGEWLLDWSDNPKDEDYKKLDQYQKEIKKYYSDKKSNIEPYNRNGNDGQFLMNFYDFSKIYHNLFTGYNFFNEKYTCYSYKSKWSKDLPSGCCKAKNAPQKDRKKFVLENFQFVFELEKEKDIMMFLIQQDGRLWRGEKYPYKQICSGLMLMAFKLDSKATSLEQFDETRFVTNVIKFELKRQVCLWHKFAPGKYAIVPCRMGGLPEQRIQQNFELRVYAQEASQKDALNLCPVDKGKKLEKIKKLQKWAAKQKKPDLKQMAEIVFENADFCCSKKK